MARNPKRTKDQMLQRTVKWPLKLSPEQEQLIVLISDGLRDYYNWALETERQSYDSYRDALKAAPDTKPNGKKFLTEIDLYTLYRAKRIEDATDSLFRAKVPANWVFETFKAAVAAYKSFFTLVKNGDHDARTPHTQEPWRFQAVPGCSAFSVKGDRVVLAPEIFGPDTLVFPIPEAYQAKMLARSVRNAKFVISRSEYDLRKRSIFSLSVSYELALPDPVPFVPEEAVYIALGASSIGVVSPHGDEVIPLWRADKHWKPLTDAVEASLKQNASLAEHERPLQKGSRKWNKLQAKRRTMFRIMGAQQKQNRREVVAIDLVDNGERDAEDQLLGHGLHFVVTDMVLRSKDGKLADSSKEERGGSLGLNWSAQNTGSIGYLVDWLSEKVREYGGSVRKHKLLYTALPQGLGQGHENKILMAHALRDDFLRESGRSRAA